ncbi:hypothetical protein C8J57DRAFT_1092939 [Mycena rebaudengoi]|nr:hypothetical protein C8J57DRAFT_1092939 [Mycena rebaudengoi]
MSKAASIAAIPLDPDCISSIGETRDLDSSCPDAQTCRTIWNIIRNSVVTIFSCTWVAVHPNILGPERTTELLWLRRLASSMQKFVSNRYAAVRDCSTCAGVRPSMGDMAVALGPHGFFVVMGGFHLFESPVCGPPERNGKRPQRSILAEPPFLHPYKTDTPRCILQERELFSPDNGFQLIVPTEDEIKDQVKSDWIAKSFVLIQTTWFLTQCIERGVEHLPIMELEIVTSAYGGITN